MYIYTGKIIFSWTSVIFTASQVLTK